MVLAKATPQIARREEYTATAMVSLEARLYSVSVNPRLGDTKQTITLSEMWRNCVNCDRLRTNQTHARRLVSVDAA